MEKQKNRIECLMKPIKDSLQFNNSVNLSWFMDSSNSPNFINLNVLIKQKYLCRLANQLVQRWFPNESHWMSNGAFEAFSWHALECVQLSLEKSRKSSKPAIDGLSSRPLMERNSIIKCLERKHSYSNQLASSLFIFSKEERFQSEVLRTIVLETYHLN